MTISPINLNGMLQRTDDVGVLKHQADHKPVVDQQNIQQQVIKHESELSHKVLDRSKNEKLDNHTNAKDEGKRQFFQNRNKKKKEENKEGKVVKKTTTSSFDIKI